jgi:hypothetical protein
VTLIRSSNKNAKFSDHLFMTIVLPNIFMHSHAHINIFDSTVYYFSYFSQTSFVTVDLYGRITEKHEFTNKFFLPSKNTSVLQPMPNTNGAFPGYLTH